MKISFRQALEITIFLAISILLISISVKSIFNATLLAYAGKQEDAVVEERYERSCGKRHRSTCYSFKVTTAEKSFSLALDKRTEIGELIPIVYLERDNTIVAQGSIISPMKFIYGQINGGILWALSLGSLCLYMAHRTYKKGII